MDIIHYGLLLQMMMSLLSLSVVSVPRICMQDKDTIRKELAEVAARILFVIFTYSSPWSKVPEDIMQLIVQRLRVSDIVRCGAVCRSWKAMIKSLEYCHPAPELPWLMLCSHPSSSIDDCFLSLSDGKVHKLLLPSNPISFCYIRERERERERERVRVQCFGSIEGLLIMVDNQNDYFFWNPISGDRLMLPSLKCQCGTGNCSTLKLAASSKPTRRVRRSQQQQPPCFVVSLCSLGRLAFCMPTDRSWNSIDEEGKLRFDDIVIVHGKLYAATRWWPRSSSALTVFDIIFQEDVNICTSDFIPGQPRYRVEKQVLLHSWPRIPLVLPWRNNNDRYISLAQDYASMELFMIHHQVTYDCDSDWQMLRRHIYSGNCIKPPKTKGFRVLKLNSTNEGGPPWEEVADLGDRILFVSNVGNKFISTNSANSALNHGERLERNCIYFAFDHSCLQSTSSGHDFGVFSLKNRTIRLLDFPVSFSGAQFPTRPVWFTPNPWWYGS